MFRPGCLAALLAATLAFRTAAQDPTPPTPPPAPDPAIEERIDALEDAWKDRKMSRDAEATRIVDELAVKLDQPIHPTDRKKIAAALTKVLTVGKLRPADATEPYRRAADGLAKLGEDGADVLIKTFERKRFPQHTEWAPMREALIGSIGRTGSEKVIPFLCERVQRSGEDGELRAAGAALGRFEQAPQSARKDAVELLARRLAGFEAEASAPPVDQNQALNLNRENAQRTLRAIGDGWKQSLAALTGESFGTGVEWQKWFQENKRKDWPDRSAP